MGSAPATTPNKTETGKAMRPSSPSDKTEANYTGASVVVAPGTGQKEVPTTWYDVNIVNGTQYTVTSYSTKKLYFPMDQVRCGLGSVHVFVS